MYNKADAAPAQAANLIAQAAMASTQSPACIVMSVRTREGIDSLRQTLLTLAGWHAAPEGVFIARERHVRALRAAANHLDVARTWARQGDAALELLAQELRLAHDVLAEITGTYSSDDLLGDIFGRFCIGK